MINLKHFRDTAKGLPDLLNYASSIEEGVLLNKDGSLTAGFVYRASDIASMTNNERNYVSAKMNALLNKFGNGWVFHIDAFRSKTSNYINQSKNHFKDPISRLIDAEREKLFVEGEHFETTLAFFLTYLPPHIGKSKIRDMMFDDSVSNKNLSIGDKTLRYFIGKIDEFQSASSNFLAIERMLPKRIEDEFGQILYQDELLKYVNHAITGNIHPINIPPVAMYLDSYIGAQPFYSGVTPKLGNTFISVVAIDGFPQQSYPNILNRLSDLNLVYRWNTRFVFMDRHNAISHLNKFRRKWNQKIRGWVDQFLNKQNGRIDEHASSMVDEIDGALAEVNSGLTSYGYFSTNIILMDTDKQNLDHNSKEVKRIIENLGFNARIEDINAVEAWLGTLPSHSVQNVRRPLMSTFNLAHLMPLDSIWAGENVHPCPFYPPQSPPLAHTVTIGSTPFRLNLHVGDLGHTLIFGPTGAGKSTLLGFLAASHRRYLRAKIIAFDMGNSLYPLTSACGGLHFDIGGEGSGNLCFAPLSNLKTDNDKAWAVEWLETMLILQGVDVTPTHRTLLFDAITLHISTGSKSLTEFVGTVQDSSLRDALEHYTLSGPAGYLLDGIDDGLTMSDFTTFEIQNLMNLGNKNIVPVLLYIFRRIEKSLDGSPAALFLDEAWVALGHSLFRDKIREWLKVLRRANCNVTLLSQSLADAAKSGILDVLQESCPTKIFLPNPEAFNVGSENSFAPYDFYKQFGLNDAQIGIIAEGTKKRDYYYVSPLGSRVFQLALGRIALSFLAVNDKESLATVKQFESDHGVDWPYRWLEFRGVPYRHLQRNNLI